MILHLDVRVFIMASGLTLPAAAQEHFLKVDSGIQLTSSPFCNGIALCDANADGWDDVFIATANVSDQFYLNEGANTFSWQPQSGLTVDSAHTMGASWGDMDNDGDLDLLVSSLGRARVYVNQGNGTFLMVYITAVEPILPYGGDCCWVDYDQDGWLDAFVSTDYSLERNYLLHNEGAGVFTRDTTAGPIVTNFNRSNACAWGDLNGDGFVDAYIGNGLEPNELHFNNGNGTFTQIMGDPSVGFTAETKGASLGDVDNDGDLDLVVVIRSGLDRLFLNDGTGAFSEVPNSPLGSYADHRGTVLFDVENDGDLDLFATDVTNWPNRLLLNDGNGMFSATVSVVNEMGQHAGVATSDLDHDGYLDLFVVNSLNPHSQFLNLGGSNTWLQVNLIGTVSNQSSIGAELWATAMISGSSRTQMRIVQGNTGHRSQSSLTAAFGFGDAIAVDQLTVKWPSGITCTFNSVPVDQVITITEDCNLVGITERERSPELRVFPNPAYNTDVLHILSDASDETLTIRTCLGQRVRYANLRNETNAAIDLTGLPAGSYLVELTARSGLARLAHLIIL